MTRRNAGAEQLPAESRRKGNKKAKEQKNSPRNSPKTSKGQERWKSEKGKEGFGDEKRVEEKVKKEVSNEMFTKSKEIEGAVSVEQPEEKKSSVIRYLLVFAFLLILTFVVRFYRIDFPPQTAFDEVYFASFALYYVRHEHYFDIHPPMAKLTFALLMHLIDFNTTHPPGGSYPLWYGEIGTDFPPDNKYIVLRAVPATLSCFTVLLAYLTLQEFGISVFGCLVGASFILLDGCWHTMSTKILTDSFLWFFQALSIYCAIRMWKLEDRYHEAYLQNKQSTPFYMCISYWFWCIATGFAMGHTASVKWTGIGVIGAIGLRHIYRTFYVLLPPLSYPSSQVVVSWSENNPSNQSTTEATEAIDENKNIEIEIVPTKRTYWPIPRDRLRVFAATFISGLLMLIILLVICYLYWVIHFLVLTKTGPGDAFMSERFQSTLSGSQVKRPRKEKAPEMWEKVWEVHKTMWYANSGLSGDHTYDSTWLTWPYMRRGVLFWDKYYTDSQDRHVMYLLGNPIGWWLQSLFLIWFCGFLVLQVVYQNEKLALRKLHYCLIGAWLLFGHLLNYVPYSRVTRSCFLYHYIPSLYWNALLVSVFVDYLFPKQHIRNLVYGILFGLTALGFWFMMPIYYATRITLEEYDNRLWFPSWI